MYVKYVTASFSPPYDPNMVYVEFDDGDSGKMPLNHIRMIPQDFPLVGKNTVNQFKLAAKKISAVKVLNIRQL